MLNLANTVVCVASWPHVIYDFMESRVRFLSEDELRFVREQKTVLTEANIPIGEANDIGIDDINNVCKWNNISSRWRNVSSSDDTGYNVYMIDTLINNVHLVTDIIVYIASQGGLVVKGVWIDHEF